MAAKCYTLAYTSARGATHYRVDQEQGVRAQEDATKYARFVADFLRRPGEEVKIARLPHEVEEDAAVEDG